MLTKNLLPCRLRNGRLAPQYLDVDDMEHLRLAKNFLHEFSDIEGQNVQYLEGKLALSGINSQSILGQAFKKLLIDRCKFAEDDGDVAQRRQKLLLDAQALRLKNDFAHLKNFQNEFYRLYDYKFSSDDQDLYGDLEDLKVIKQFKNFSDASALLHRYNCALVQGLLLQAKSLRLTLQESSLEDRRLLFRRLKFFRLFTDISAVKKGGHLQLEISGPLQIFQNAQTYGLRLANFFPHVLFLPKWQLEAEVKYKKQFRTLKLDSSLGLKSHYQWQPAYIPKEFHAFMESFNQQSDNWRVTCCEEWLPGEGSTMIFPDFVLINKVGKKIYFELLHKWHAGALKNRIELVSQGKTKSLLLGVHKSLKHQKQNIEILQNAKNLTRNLLYFSEFPLPSQVLQWLNEQA